MVSLVKPMYRIFVNSLSYCRQSNALLRSMNDAIVHLPCVILSDVSLPSSPPAQPQQLFVEYENPAEDLWSSCF